MIDRATRRMRELNSTSQIMCTFLDEFSTVAQVGERATFADSYWAADISLRFTGGAQRYAYDIDVTWIDPSAPACSTNLFPSDHGWPVEFYEQTILAAASGPPFPNPIWQGSGFKYSMEGGNSYVDGMGEPHWNVSALPALNLPPLDDKNELNLYVDVQCVPASHANSTTPTSFGQRLVVPGPCGASVNQQSFTLTNCVQSPLAGAAQSAEPAWVNFSGSVDEGSEFLQIDVEFTSGRPVQGLLSIYLDGEMLLSLDERFAMDGISTITAGIPPETVAGTHSLGFRLDAFSNEPSSVMVNNIRQGRVMVTPLCIADVEGGNDVVDIDDLLLIINQWGPSGPPGTVSGDIAPLGGNGIVDIDDLLVIINGWGACP